MSLLDWTVICAGWLGLAVGICYFTARFIAVANRRKP